MLRRIFSRYPRAFKRVSLGKWNNNNSQQSGFSLQQLNKQNIITWHATET